MVSISCTYSSDERLKIGVKGYSLSVLKLDYILWASLKSYISAIPRSTGISAIQSSCNSYGKDSVMRTITMTEIVAALI